MRWLLLVVCAWWISPAGAARWQWSNPRPHGNNILDMELREEVIWQVGDRGRIYTTADLDHWLPRESGTTKSLRSITSFKGNVFISGAEGTVVSGPNHLALTVRTLPTTAWLEGIAATETAVVAVGDDGSIYASSDGQQWTLRTNYPGASLTSIAARGGTFVAVGTAGFVVHSSNSIYWTRQSPFTAEDLNGVNVVGETFWITGNKGVIATNLTRLSGWGIVPSGVTNNLFTVAGSNSEVISAGEGIVLAAPHPFNNWTRQPTGRNDWPLYSSLWDGRLYLVGGRSGMLLEGFRTNSTSALQWFSTETSTRNFLWSVTRTPHVYMATGSGGTVVTSDNGFNWDREVTPSAVQREILFGVAGNTNLGVAVGSAGAVIYTQSRITNGVNYYGVIWEAAFPRPTTKSLHGVAERDGLFVAVGAEGTVLTSQNGALWSMKLPKTVNTLSSVAAGPNYFVATGDLGTILRSPNGSDWEVRNSGVTNWIYTVRWIGNEFMAVGEAGILLRSPDGESWQHRNIGATHWFNDIAYAQGQYHAVADGGYLATSQDAIIWQHQPAMTIRSLLGLAPLEDGLLAAGADGAILNFRSYPRPRILDYDRAADVNTFLFGGTPGQYLNLEYTPALAGEWMLDGELQVQSPDGTVVYQTHTLNSREFYRLLSQP